MKPEDVKTVADFHMGELALVDDLSGVGNGLYVFGFHGAVRECD